MKKLIGICIMLVLIFSLTACDGYIFDLQNQIADLKDENRQLKDDIKDLEDAISELEEEKGQLEDGIKELEDAIADLEKRLDEKTAESLKAKILIIEKSNESSILSALLTDYDIEIVNIASVPNTFDIEDLIQYDEIILMNIANSDMPNGFAAWLHAYVYDYGGGLLTVGGNEDDGVTQHAYNRSDMFASMYQVMMPVQCIDYTPPAGVMVIMDTSSSMNQVSLDGVSRLEWARNCASEYLKALSYNDYFGLITFNTSHNLVLPLTPRTQETQILTAIESINTAEGGTEFKDAIKRAGDELKDLNFARRHILIITDGAVSPSEREAYEAAIGQLYNNYGITLSIVGIDIEKDNRFDETNTLEEIGTNNLSAYTTLLRAIIIGHGRIYTSDLNMVWLSSEMREEFAYPILEYVPEYFAPVLKSETLSTGITGGLPELGGFYGSKLKAGGELVLATEFDVPVYAQWQFGIGRVGSFMCDLNGAWSDKFISNADENSNGISFILNAVKWLLPQTAA